MIENTENILTEDPLDDTLTLEELDDEYPFKDDDEVDDPDDDESWNRRWNP